MPSTLGSGLWAKQHANIPHLGGLRGETADVRQDINKVLTPMAAIAVEEFTNPAAPDVAGLLIATASSVAVQVKLAAALIAGGKTALAAFPRNVTFTTAGVTPSDAPATATIVGTDINDAALTEVVTLAQTATIAQGVKAFKTLVSITYAAGDGVGATVSIGFGKVFGLSRPIKSRAGLAFLIKEVAAGAVVTTGTVVAAATGLPYGTWSPATDPNGANDYAIYYEYDASLTTDG